MFQKKTFVFLIALSVALQVAPATPIENKLEQKIKPTKDENITAYLSQAANYQKGLNGYPVDLDQAIPLKLMKELLKYRY